MVLKISLLMRRKTSSWDIPQQKDKPNDITHHQILKRIIHCILQRRHIVALLGFMCTAVMQSHRLLISIAMVAMVNITSTMSTNRRRNATEECPAYYTNVSIQEQFKGEFDWSPELQGYILSSGYLGYFLTQIPAGILAKIHGSKKLLVGGLFVDSACNLLSPVAARANPYLLMALALIRGMAQGIQMPALFVLMSKWFPKDERGVLCTFIYNGSPIGTILTGLVGGKLCELDFMGGWPLIFYVFGLVSIILTVAFIIFYNDLPEEDPWISEFELKHIQDNVEKIDSNECPPTPWLRMLMSVPTLALILALFGAYWMIYYALSIHPIYYGTILKIPLAQNGIQTAISFTFQAIAGWFTCYYCYKNKRFKVDTLRKGINSFSVLLFFIGMLGIYFAKCDIVLNEVFFHIALFGTGFSYGGSFITVVDMTPTFCGPLMGFASTVASLAGFIVPIVAGKLTNEEQSLTQWGKVFLITIGIIFGSGLIFQLFGSAEIQPYDPASVEYPEDSNTKEDGSNSGGTRTLTRF